MNIAAFFARLFKNTYSYRFHLRSGTAVVVRNARDLRIVTENGVLIEFELKFWHGADNRVRHMNPLDIVAIERL